MSEIGDEMENRANVGKTPRGERRKKAKEFW